MSDIYGTEHTAKILKYVIQENRPDLLLLFGEGFFRDHEFGYWNIYNLITNWYKSNNALPKPETLRYLIKESQHESQMVVDECLERLDIIMKMEIDTDEVAELTGEIVKFHTLRSFQKKIDEDLLQAKHDVNYYIAKLQKVADACRPNLYRENEVSIDDIVREIINMPETRYSTGYPKLDKCTKGIEPSTSWCIGAPTTVGKTMMTLNIAYNLAKQNIHVTFFSTEMITRQIVQRLLTILTGINPSLLGTLSEEDESGLIAASTHLKSLPIRILYTRSLADIYRQIKKEESRLYIVDQIQTVNPFAGQNNGEVKRLGNISSQLADYAKQHGVCIIMTSQINRMSRSAPSISGYRGSGEIEENVDIGITLEACGSYSSSRFPNRRNILLKIGKNRIHGLESDIYYFFDPNTLRIDEESSEG